MLSPDRTDYDLPVVAAIFCFVAAFIVVLNLAADLVQAALDPRARFSGSR